MTITAAVPTTNGDSINPVDSWAGGGATAQRLFQFYRAVGLVPTMNGNQTTPPPLWGSVPVNVTNLGYVLRGTLTFSAWDQSQWRGWTFVIDPATLQPQLPRNTNFPAAQ